MKLIAQGTRQLKEAFQDFRSGIIVKSSYLDDYVLWDEEEDRNMDCISILRHSRAL